MPSPANTNSTDNPSTSSTATTPTPSPAQQHATTTTTTTTTTRVRGSLIPNLDTSTPAINAGSPVEIDGTPTSPDRVMRPSSTWEKGGAGAASRSEGSGGGNMGGSSPDYLAREGEVLVEFGLGGGTGANRAALLQSRKRDPAVLVDIPQGPSVEDFAAAGLLSPDFEEKKVEPAR